MSDQVKRILLIEDDAVTRNLIRNVLAEGDYQVVDAPDCHAARQAIAGPQAFDCIVLDRGLPDGDGLALLREFKQQPALHDVPMVVQTVRGQDDEVREGIEAGAHYYLTKPLQRGLLRAIIDAAVAGARELRIIRAEMQAASNVLSLLDRGQFHLRDIQQARALAQALAPLCAHEAPENAALVLQELLVNAVEHGNLEISYAGKSELVLSGAMLDEIERRLRDPVLGARQVQISLIRTPGKVQVTIQDQGKGFEWQDFMELSPDRAFDPNGRGIFIARSNGADSIDYSGSGNTVTATWLTPH